MTTQSTVDKLREMRLSAMASAFEGQCGTDADTWNGLSFEDRFGMLVDGHSRRECRDSCALL